MTANGGQPDLMAPTGTGIRSMIVVLLLAGLGTVNAAEVLFLENAFLRVEFSSVNGAITRISNKKRGLEFIAVKAQEPRGWALMLDRQQWVSDFESFRAIPDVQSPREILSFEWRTKYQITVTARAELRRDSDELRLTSSATNFSDRTILALRYPDIQGIGTLSAGGEADRLLHSTMMGAVFNNPFHLFTHDSNQPQGRGMTASRYPNGFHGSALQLMALYAEAEGGFYIGVEDGRSTDKDLNFFKATLDSLSLEVAHFNWDAQPGKSLSIDYPVIIAPLLKGTWHEAAGRYRTWALLQDWCKRGTRRERIRRGQASRWLCEDIGATGAWWPFREDIRPQIEQARDLFQAPLLHLELWWQHAPSVSAAGSAGDRFGPFYFPHLALKGMPPFEDHKTDRILPEASVISPDWAVMCASQPNWRRIFSESAEDMAGNRALRHHQIWMDDNQTGCLADCLYFDIGPCAGVPTHCYAAGHAHAPGAGRQITDDHVSLFRESQTRASKAKGAYVPVGTECVSEPFVSALDFHYSRNAGLGLDMELLPYVRQLTWLPDGKMEIVPLFDYVYHEHGPLAVQGIYSVSPWGQPASDDINTWAEARSYLWGGIIATMPLPPNSVVTPERKRFLRSLAAARTGFATKYLAYGRMQPPPLFKCGTIKLDHGLAEGGWLRKLRFGNAKTAAAALDWHDVADPPATRPSTESGSKPKLSVDQWVKGMLAVGGTPAATRTLTVPSVVCNAFTLGDNRLALLGVNLARGERGSLRIPIDPVAAGLRSGNYQLQLQTMDGTRALGTFRDFKEVEIELPSREVVLLEAVRK